MNAMRCFGLAAYVFLSIAIPTATVQAAGIAFSSPSAGQSYANDAPINFGGSGYWEFGTESPTTDIQVELRWFGNDTQTYSAGAICDSGEANIVFGKDSNHTFTGAYTFENHKDAYGTSTFTANRYGIFAAYYRLYATPERQHGPYSDNGDDIRTELNLGFIN